MTGEPAGKRRRGRPKGSYKKPQLEKVLQKMSAREKAFLQEARDGDLYPAREHKVVNRVCAAIVTLTGIIVEGDRSSFAFCHARSPRGRRPIKTRKTAVINRPAHTSLIQLFGLQNFLRNSIKILSIMPF